MTKKITARENLYNALASAHTRDGHFARSLGEAAALIAEYDRERDEHLQLVNAGALDAALESGKIAGRTEALDILRGTFGEDAVDIMLRGGTIEIKPMEKPEVETGKEKDDEGEEAPGHTAG